MQARGCGMNRESAPPGFRLCPDWPEDMGAKDRRGEPVLLWVLSPEQRTETLHSGAPLAVLIVRYPEATGGVMVWAKYAGQAGWHCNTAPRWAVRALLELNAMPAGRG